MLTPAANAWQTRWFWPMVAGLMLVHATLVLSSITRLSGTFDELAHMTAGYSYWQTGDYRLHPENGWLPQRITGLGLKLAGAEPIDTADPLWQRSDVWFLGRQWLYGDPATAGSRVFAGRLPMVLVSVLTGLLVAGWSQRRFGDAGGLLSAWLYAFSPTMLAHGGLATSDVTAAGLFFASCVAVWRVLHRPGVASVFLAGIAVGALGLAKFSAGLLVPMAGLMVIARLIAGDDERSRGRLLAQAGVAAGCVGLIAWVVLWSAYGWRWSISPSEEPYQLYRSMDMLMTAQGASAPMAKWLMDAGVIPEAYGYGLITTLKYAQQRWSFLNGDISLTGFATFFPWAFVLKTPIPVMVMIVLALGWWGRRYFGLRIEDFGSKDSTKVGEQSLETSSSLPIQNPQSKIQNPFYASFPLVALIGVYAVASLTTNLNIGHRHLLPIYPAMFALLGGAAGWVFSGVRPMRLAVPVLAGLLAVESLLAWPAYLRYFQPLAGGTTDGWHALVDSSFDWGQDLPTLRRWLDENSPPGEPLPLYLSYFGSATPEAYGITGYTNLAGTFGWERSARFDPLGPGWYAISATTLQGLYLSNTHPWTPQLEEHFHMTHAIAQAWQQVKHDPARADAFIREVADGDRGVMKRLAQRYNELRMARLSMYLRQRGPDDQAGSILLFKLTETDLATAMQ